ncbi:MAG TPA: hypothetical protein VFF53_07180 [Geobacteraceae bacterium]|nr:hypothetical protein [Geobacteraceae bacterium]
MHIKSVVVALILAVTAMAHGAGEGISFEKNAQDVISKKCTGCHGEERIKAAFSAGKDMRAIQMDMQRRGAKLTGSEQEVLGIYWKKPRAK